MLPCPRRQLTPLFSSISALNHTAVPRPQENAPTLPPIPNCKDTLDVAIGKEKTFKDFFGMVKALERDDLESIASKVRLGSKVDESVPQIQLVNF